jgi:division protein CdvB (Snf7/Vps24/ESCRT-III family)
MNKETRKELEKVIEIINDLKEILTTVIDEEQSKYDNLPEGLQQAENGAKMEESVASLEEALSHLDEAIDSIETVTI